MERDQPGGYVVPNPRIPKVMGILHILFASLLLVGGLCSAGSFALSPVVGRAFTRIQKEAAARNEAQKKAALDALDEQEKLAETDVEKQQIADRRHAVQNAPGFQGFEMDPWKAFPLHERRFQIYVWADVGSAFLLNLMMLAAGIGLVQRVAWGRKLGIWNAWLKLVRLMLVYGYVAIVIVPVFSTSLARFAVESIALQQQAMGRPMPARISFGDFAFIYSVAMTASAVGMIVFGSIYPAVSLFLLTRPSAKAACDPENRLREEGETW